MESAGKSTGSCKGLFMENRLYSDTLDVSELKVRCGVLGLDVSLPRTVIVLHEFSPSAVRRLTNQDRQPGGFAASGFTGLCFHRENVVQEH